MAHSEFRGRLIDLANANASNPMGFLEGLSPIHDDWHSENVRTYGFLLFHFRVLRYFRDLVSPALDAPIVPFTAQDFQDMAVQPLNVNPQGANTLATLATLSASIEDWHNSAHMQIGMATQAPMMDARTNIYYRPFWQLHFFIDDLFQQALQAYGDNAHSGQFLNLASIAAHIEESHHSWVPQI